MFSKPGEDCVDDMIEAWNVRLRSEFPFYKQIFGERVLIRKMCKSLVREKSDRKLQKKKWRRSDKTEPNLNNNNNKDYMKELRMGK